MTETNDLAEAVVVERTFDAPVVTFKMLHECVETVL
jgi:hypothetical protein